MAARRRTGGRNRREVRATGEEIALMRRSIASMERAGDDIGDLVRGRDIMYDICGATCVEEFDRILKQSTRMLSGRLGSSLSELRISEALHQGDIFRLAARHDLIDEDAAERWRQYQRSRELRGKSRDEHFAHATLQLLPDFVADAKALAVALEAAED